MRIARSLGFVVMLSAAAAAVACSGGEATSAAVGPRDGGPGGAQGASGQPRAGSGGQEGGGARGAQRGPVPVAITSVAQKPMTLQLTAVGAAEAYSTVQIHAQITGALESVQFREGDDVQKGQVLFTLDRRPLEAALAQAQANLQRDIAQAANARTQAQRYMDLAQRGIATKEQVEQNTTNAAALDATVAADRASVANAQVQLQYATITSPLTGRTGALQVNAGNLVRANDATPLVTINQVAPIYVTFGIPEAQLANFQKYLAAGTVKVEANPPNATTPPSVGKITFVDNQVDQTTGQIKLKGTFQNGDRRLWPGEFLNVTVTLSTEPKAIVVPSMAVQTGQQGQYVFVVKPDQTVEMRTVEVERTSGAESVIRRGVQPGETVVTDGQLNLVSGSRITVKSGNAARTTS